MFSPWSPADTGASAGIVWWSMHTPTECICCQELRTTADKTGMSQSSTIKCITEHEGFDAVYLNVNFDFTYRQHYGTHDVRDEPLHQWVLSYMETSTFLNLLNNKLYRVQAVQVYCLSAIKKMVLGLAREMSTSYHFLAVPSKNNVM